MKTGIIVLARMGASRLPGKVLKKICGKSVIEHVIHRLQKVNADSIIVATTINPDDDEIVKLCKKISICFFRGDEENVLKRCIDAIAHFKFDTIVRLGADSAVADPEVINEMLKIFIKECERGNRLDYLSNTLERSYPIGIDSEIFDSSTFRKIHEKIQALPEKERRLNEINVVPYLHQHLEEFNTYSFVKDFDYTSLRWTLDTPEDLALLTNIYESLYPSNPDFLMNDILELLRKHPEWSAINTKITPVSGYWTKSEKERMRKQFKGKSHGEI